MKIIATDLDRTLLPNGVQPYDKTMGTFGRIIQKQGFGLIFVTGRNLRMVEEVVIRYKTPLPDYIIGEVGTSIFRKCSKGYARFREWDKYILDKTPIWDIDNFKRCLKKLKFLQLQERENQNKFKLSYYFDGCMDIAKIYLNVKKRVNSNCAEIIVSVDETRNLGLLDILPKTATKKGALLFITKKLKMKKKDVVYAGDSGNDLLALAAGFKSILVRNATRSVRKQAKALCKDRLYIASGKFSLNGYYVSGIIEGLIAHNFIEKSILKEC